MSKFFSQIDEVIREFIQRQHMFFVATAPLGVEARINLSPKGLDCFRILSDRSVAYLDLTGSGNETSAHLEENGRITIMFCAFEGAPNILRIYGRGRTVLPSSPEWENLFGLFPTYPGTRQIFIVEIDQIQTSCGYAVPLYEFKSDRQTLIKYSEQQGEVALSQYRDMKNRTSIDGLPTSIGRHNTRHPNV